MKVHTATKKQKLHAEQTAKNRRDFHSKLGSQRHWHDKKKGEYNDEYYGSLGHIVFQEAIEKTSLGDNSQFAPLYVDDLSQLPAWDALVLGKTVEIKTIPPDDDGVKRQRLLVKVAEFKHMDYYVAIKFLDKERFYFVGYIKGEELVTREPRNFGFAPAYWRFLNELTPFSLIV